LKCDSIRTVLKTQNWINRIKEWLHYCCSDVNLFVSESFH